MCRYKRMSEYICTEYKHTLYNIPDVEYSMYMYKYILHAPCRDSCCDWMVMVDFKSSTASSSFSFSCSVIICKYTVYSMYDRLYIKCVKEIVVNCTLHTTDYNAYSVYVPQCMRACMVAASAVFDSTRALSRALFSSSVCTDFVF
jgi:hypothetical protein